MKYKGVIFDFDLTLADSTKGILICYKETLKHFGFSVPSDEEIFNTIGKTIEDSLEILTGQKLDNVIEMRKYYVSVADGEMTKNTVFYPNSIAVLQVLKTAGLKIGIVSNKYKYRIEEAFEQKAGSFPIDEIIGREFEGNAKPDPSSLLTMINLLNLEKEDVLYVGDSFIDAQTAKNASVDFAGVTTGSSSKEELNKYPNIAICESILDIVSNISSND